MLCNTQIYINFEFSGMLMDLKPALKKLQQSPSFRKWHDKNKSTYFSYAFKIPQEMQENEWQLGFYDSKSDKITTFVMKNDSIDIRKEDDVFKEDETKVHQLEMDKIKLDLNEALAKAVEFQSKNYPKDRSVKTIAILQNIAGSGNIWNITFITESFNMLNMKIDASTGSMASYNLSSILSLRKE